MVEWPEVGVLKRGSPPSPEGVSAIASTGAIRTDPLAERGDPRDHVAAPLGILLPPSIAMILCAVVARRSVAARFASSIGPPIFLILGLVLYNRFLVGRAFEEAPGRRQLGGRAPAAAAEQGRRGSG